MISGTIYGKPHDFALNLHFVKSVMMLEMICANQDMTVSTQPVFLKNSNDVGNHLRSTKPTLALS